MFTKYIYGVHKKAGGMEIYVKDLVDALIKKGHKITIITSRHPGGIKKETKGNLIIYHTNMPITPNPLSRIKFFKESAKLFRKINKQRKFHIIHGQSDMAYGYVRYCKKGIPFINTTHGTTINEFVTSLKVRFWLLLIWIILLPLYYSIEKRVFISSEKIICVSKELRKDVIRQYNMPEKTITIFNGVDTKRFKPLPKNRVHSIKGKYAKDDERIILSVGVITKQKGFHILIKSFKKIAKRLPKAKLLIIGDGLYLQKLKLLTKKLELTKKVIFLGKINNKNIHKLYNLADICVFPTLRLEGLPYVVLESMACGKPAITSRIGGIPTLIENNKNGILIEPGNLKELEEKILEVLDNKNLAKELGENARKEAVEKFSLDKMVDDTIKVYKKVLEK